MIRQEDNDGDDDDDDDNNNEEEEIKSTLKFDHSVCNFCRLFCTETEIITIKYTKLYGYYNFVRI